MEANWVFGIGTIVATLLGPILAVQAQKYLERVNESRNQKNWIFSTLMATRAARLSPDHVRALNMIDLAFNGGRSNRRKASETDVLDTWRDYLEHLTSTVNEDNAERWVEKQQELLILMLSAMATDLNLRYDRVLLRNGAYIPKGHTDLELDQQKLRHYAIEVLSGQQPISMNVTGFPFSEEMTNSQLKLQEGLFDVLAGQGHLKIRIEPGSTAETDEKAPA
ncbi:hypothetical protein C1Y08_01655 [Pseudomonas sp. FW306-02-F02-AA]|uniref:DUF6680 domain-containing protein n=2 Tax=Pseudomonas TaxID=286 RepID=A0A0N9VPI3_PSEFL|nr:hypothetical protein AO353_02925 [Pseudomonas fluorescens]PMZ06195.1 hypothetical protein C1Y07_01260 [Pseudomonas sp. FW306-02-F02-AB]PMZ11574.1 hypothetical protein C1Y06_01880 [Pseudomonas sp. FW306-02-H06C]PMZ17497.1 hypothetical protein C1Y08_01655 [Pseudomonas sp. FW306-02-F02-AA]PMZ21747.1 hypothetical protein C1Y09_11660 [Pseudomonas sp. FW306-02-F08-AA]PMZ25582.1 hypothetical protein C1Y05_22770 [Pseudomonas sp. FW306-02-F04-BA]PMZ35522.1 hypothetical protein C1X99_06355 [Pseudomo